VFARQSWAAWEQEGRPSLLDRAHREVERILDEGYPPEQLLSAEAAAQLDEIAGQARAALAPDQQPVSKERRYP
jgi:trimethylamine:corrinoid methyltransferase-like protein